jgi:DNA topoisomerase-1
MAAAHGEYYRVKTQIEGDADFTWMSQWKRTLFEGWKQAGKVMELEESDEMIQDVAHDNTQDMTWEKAVALKVGDVIQWKTMHAESKETKAQGRYTEATLVRELEKHGIGRPSTFASLLSAIQDKNYVEIKDIPAREVSVTEYVLTANQWPANEKATKKKVGAEKNKLVPTELGQSVLTFLLQHFTDLFDYDMTSHMEKRLDRIAEGAEPWKQILHDIWQSYQERYRTLLQTEQKDRPHAKVREFTNGLKAVQSKKGPLLLIEGAKKEDTIFIGWPANISFEEMTEEMARSFQKEEEKKGEFGMWKDQPIQKKSGKFGTYLQCGDVSVPFIEEEIEKTMERLEAKANGKNGSVINGFVLALMVKFVVIVPEVTIVKASQNVCHRVRHTV